MKSLINKSLPFFIARRIAGDKSMKEFKAAHVMTRVAILSVVISVVVMIVAVTIVDGFSVVIDAKVKGILSSYQIVRYDNNFSSEKGFIYRNESYVKQISEFDFIDNITAYATKNGVAKNSGEISGIILKGIEDEVRIEFYRDFLISGSLPSIGGEMRVKEMIISSSLASHLKLKSGDMVELMFIENPPLRERFKVTGIYDTSLSTLDKMLAITDLRNVQNIYRWSDEMIGGYDVTVKRNVDVTQKYDLVCEVVDNEPIDDNDVAQMVINIPENYPQIYSWLDLQKSNEVVVITIMLIVAAINIISMVLIIILQKLYLMGVLSVLGMNSGEIRKILIYRSLSVVIKALVIGNIVAIGLLLLQQKFKLIKLDGDGYFLDSVPVSFDWMKILFINVITILVMLFFQWLTTYVVFKFSPSNIIKYEKR